MSISGDTKVGRTNTNYSTLQYSSFWGKKRRPLSCDDTEENARHYPAAMGKTAPRRVPASACTVHCAHNTRSLNKSLPLIVERSHSSQALFHIFDTAIVRFFCSEVGTYCDFLSSQCCTFCSNIKHYRGRLFQ